MATECDGRYCERTANVSIGTSRMRRLALSLSIGGAVLVTLLLIFRMHVVAAPASGRYRFGFGAARGGITDYDVAQLRAGWYVDWAARMNPPRPAGLEFVQMIRLHQLTECWPQRTRDRDACPYVEPYTYTLKSPTTRSAVVAIAQANPGSLWLIGNEMDRRDWEGGGQDEMLPELYARAYHELYHLIKEADPQASIAIGGVVQPTPLRLEYLDKVLAEYQTRYGSMIPVDVWNIHNMILREVIYQYGADIPPGSSATSGELYTWHDADDIDIFQQQIEDFRQWMKDQGERDKPLIISEYSVLYGEAQGFDYQRVTDFMYATFDYLTTATDPDLGYPADDNRLVQRWAWYSLDDAAFEGHATHHHLFDPVTKEITQLGIDYGAYGLTCPIGTLTPLTFDISVDLQRPNAAPPHPSWAVPVRLSLHPPGDADTVCHQWELVLNQSGGWSGELKAYAGLYDVRAKNMHTLRNVRRNVEITATNQIHMGTLLEGDATDNNRVRIADYGVLRNAYFTDEGDPDFDPRADFDEDGKIRIRDFSLLRLNYFKDGDIEEATAAGIRGTASHPVDLSVDPPTSTLQVGHQGTVTITAHAGAQEVIGVEFELRFDPQLLQIIDAVPEEPGVQVEPVGPFTEADVIFNVVDRTAGEGRVRYAVGTLGEPVAGAISLARLHLRGTAPTTGTVLHLARADVVDPLGRSVVGEPADGTVIIQGELLRCFLPLVIRADSGNFSYDKE